MLLISADNISMETSGSAIVERIDSLLKAKNLKRQAAADFAGISLQAFTHWSLRGSIPAADTAIKIADFLGVDVRWLITGDDANGLSDEERKLVSDYRDISAAGRDAVRMLLDGYVKQSVEEKNKGVASSQ